MKIAVLASGNGSNFEALANTFKEEIVLLISNKKDAHALKRAANHNIKSAVLGSDKEIVSLLKKEEIDIVLLAGYMKMLSPYFVDEYRDRILNIHPSLLPEFPGLESINRAFEAKVGRTGVTVHLVDEGMDTGKILAQKEIVIQEDDSLESLTERIHALEHEIYQEVVRNYLPNFS